MGKTKEDFANELATFDMDRRALRIEIKGDHRDALKNYDKETRKLRSMIMRAFDEFFAALAAEKKAKE